MYLSKRHGYLLYVKSFSDDTYALLEPFSDPLNFTSVYWTVEIFFLFFLVLFLGV